MLGIVYILCTYSILEYLWNILNILGILPQYSGLVFIIIHSVYGICTYRLMPALSSFIDSNGRCKGEEHDKPPGMWLGLQL